MKTKIIEVTNGFNWGKFLLGRFDTEWSLRSQIEVPDDDGFIPLPLHAPLLRQLGWGLDHLWVLDLQTGEGALFRTGGMAGADLDKHKVWVCPMFEPMLTWLYRQDLTDLDALPSLVTFTEDEAPSAMFGYRRSGVEA